MKETITVHKLIEKKKSGIKITALTAYDYLMASILDKCDIDVILVGDSAANIVGGYATTIPITLEQMIYHASCVTRGVKKAMVIGDMPFMSYQVSPEQALENAGKMMKESGVNGVKLEGGEAMIETIKRMVDIGIPVMGHLGLTPQSVHAFGGYHVQAKEEKAIDTLIKDAQHLQKAGCFAIVLEKIPADIAEKVTQTLEIPTIGIGAGKQCDGQILVTQDMLGLNPSFKPKFLRQYANLYKEISEATKQYIDDVKSKKFPALYEQY